MLCKRSLHKPDNVLKVILTDYVLKAFVRQDYNLPFKQAYDQKDTSTSFRRKKLPGKKKRLSILITLRFSAAVGKEPFGESGEKYCKKGYECTYCEDCYNRNNNIGVPEPPDEYQVK